MSFNDKRSGDHPMVSLVTKTAPGLALGTRAALVGLIALVLGGCITNPVTGRSELALVTPARELAIGKQNYIPAQQSQGGQLTVDPDLTRYVRGVGERMAAASGVDLPYEFVVLNNPVPNAWAMPGGKIAINRGLLTELGSEAELAAVLGHEVTHAAARHGAKSMQRGMFMQGALVATAIISSQRTEYANQLVGAAQVAANLISTKYGRDAERESDHYGTRWLAAAGYDPSAAVDLQQTFVRLSEGRRSDWLSGLFSSHPPSTERVANNQRLVAKLREEGAISPDAERGTQRYAEAMGFINDRKDAYKAQDEARKALSEGNFETALEQINSALKSVPNEASFHGTRGDIRYKQKRFEDAITNYARAIDRDAGYYHYYLGRGMATAKLADARRAKSDLESSLKLLPTATAYNELGKIAELEGNQDLALKYYAAAGGSQSNEGAAARARFATLDIPRRPAQYVKTRVVANQQGLPVLLVANSTQIALANVEVQVELGWANGQSERLRRVIRQLPAGRQVTVALPNRNMQLTRQASAATAAQPATSNRSRQF